MHLQEEGAAVNLARFTRFRKERMRQSFKVPPPNAIFCSLLLSFIFVPGILAFNAFALQSGDDPTYIALENRLATSPKKPTLASLLDKTFQSTLETALEDRIPFKSEAALVNAAVQRLPIAISARLYNFKAYPTYYGSQYAYESEQDAVVPFPAPIAVDLQESLINSTSAMNSVAADNPEIAVFYCEPPHQAYAPSNPLLTLFSHEADDRLASQIIEGQLSSHITTIKLAPSDSSGETSYRTEHHWSMAEAYTGYRDILSVMDASAAPVSPEREIRFDAPFYGSYTRLGLCMTNNPDSVSDIVYPESSLHIEIDGEEKTLEDLRHRSLYSNREWDPKTFTLRYEEYYHWNVGLIAITNEDIDSDRTLLIVGDSYSNSIERLFAENYKTVYCIDPRYYQETVPTFLQTHHVDDLLFLLCPPTLALPNVQAQIEG